MRQSSPYQIAVGVSIMGKIGLIERKGRVSGFTELEQIFVLRDKRAKKYYSTSL